MNDRDGAIRALNAALTHSGSGVLRERALQDAALLARSVLLAAQFTFPEDVSGHGKPPVG